MLAIPKPVPRRKLKARAKRAESKVATAVRAAVMARDRACRLADPQLVPWFGQCEGGVEWAHLGDARRFKTRAMAPEDRHSSAGSLALCAWHHCMYDNHKLDIQPGSSRGADGPLAFRRGSVIHMEKCS